MRIAARSVGSRPTRAQQPADIARRRRRRGTSPCTTRRLADDVGDAQARVERGDTGPGRSSARRASGVAPLRAGACGIGWPSKRTLALARRQDAGDDAPERRLAAAGFADQADDLALARSSRSTPSTARTTVFTAARAEQAARSRRRDRAASTKRFETPASSSSGVSCARRCQRQGVAAAQPRPAPAASARAPRAQARVARAQRGAEGAARRQVERARASCRGSA